jgi:hypothetical protein
MKPRRGHLVSLPFLTLYFVAAAAVVLHLTRGLWGGHVWFPIVTGFVAAAGIIALQHVVEGLVRPTPAKPWLPAVFFFVCAAVLLTGSAYFVRTEPRLALWSVLLSGVFLWAALGTLNEWPGFRPPRNPESCPGCGYNLTGNRSGVCPECGRYVGIVEDDEEADSIDRAKDYDPLSSAVLIMGGLNLCWRCGRQAFRDAPAFTDDAYAAQAERLRAEGWTSNDGVHVYCPDCSGSERLLYRRA